MRKINTIINNENVKKLIPSNIKFLWSVKSITSTTDANGQVNNIDGEVIELFIILKKLIHVSSLSKK